MKRNQVAYCATQNNFGPGQEDDDDEFKIYYETDIDLKRYRFRVKILNKIRLADVIIDGKCVANVSVVVCKVDLYIV